MPFGLGILNRLSDVHVILTKYTEYGVQAYPFRRCTEYSTIIRFRLEPPKD
jgi:hypothetical protein